mgnify:CR=1 FL=1
MHQYRQTQYVCPNQICMTLEEKQYHLNTISNAIMEIESYSAEMDYNQFTKAEQAKRIIGRNLQVIGNEVMFTKDFLQDEFTEFDFETLERMKHANYNSEAEMMLYPVFDIIKKDLPEIRERINEVSLRLDREAAERDSL